MHSAAAPRARTATEECNAAPLRTLSDAILNLLPPRRRPPPPPHLQRARSALQPAERRPLQRFLHLRATHNENS